MKQFPEESDGIDWSLCTWEGAEREQQRQWDQLPLREKLQTVEDMEEIAERFLSDRKARRLPYFDLYTGALVNPVSSSK